MNKIIIKVFFLIVVFIASFSIWYSPVLFKGYAPYKMTEIMPIAKNLHKTGIYSMEDRQSIFLPASLIKKEGEIATSGNKLTAYLYAGIFKFTGVLSPDKLVVVSIIVNSLSLLIFTFAVLRLFGFGVAGLFSAIYIFIPYNWESVYSLGTYEFAILFFALFSLFFLLGREKKRELIYMISAGIFLALSALSREVFFVTMPILAVFLWRSDKKKNMIFLFAPVILILSIFYLPSLFGNNRNNYSSYFVKEGNQGEQLMDSTFYEHLYPDPYTYLFVKKEFLNNNKEKISKMNFVEALFQKKVLDNLGIENIGLIDRFLLGMILFFMHLFRFISLEIFGGTFVLMFVLIGLYSMKQKDNNLYKFSIYWLSGTVFLLSFAALVSRSHLRDFNWIFPLLASLGIFFFGEILKSKLNISGKLGIVLLGVISAIFIYHLILTDHVVFGKIYDGNPALMLSAYSEKIKEKNIGDNDVIAMGLNSKEQIVLSYLSDKSMVIFTPQTIKKLIEEKKLQEIFDKFNVKYFLGYDNNLSLEILANAKAENIASKTIKIKQPGISPLKSLFMGIVR